MSTEVKKEIQLEIAHVLFIDIVGYSKFSINDQHAAVEELNQIVRASEQFQKAEADSRLLKIPTGDGMALVFYTTPEAPAQCAIEISRALKEHPRLRLRMGIHSGPVSGVVDVNGRANVAGAGLNMAQRVMDCGDAGHILLSKHVAEDLEEYEQWRPLLHDLGTCEVKHGVRLAVTNLSSDGVGNPQLPEKFQALKKRQTRARWAEVAIAVLVLSAVVVASVFVLHRPTRLTLAAPEKSIAVMPLVNTSGDPNNEYFSDGLSEELIAVLAKIPGLKVIGRNSSFLFKGKSDNSTSIGQKLGVAQLIEGSVRRQGDRVRIVAEMIRATDGEELWSETYEREVKDIFAVQSEIAQAVVAQLKIKLLGEKPASDAAPPNRNPAAHDALLQSRFYVSQENPASLRKAINYAEEATRLDPGYVAAWAALSSASRKYAVVFATDDIDQAHVVARRAADKAFTLSPKSVEALRALSGIASQFDFDFVAAEKYARGALEVAPGDTSSLVTLSDSLIAQGRLEEAKPGIGKLEAADPLQFYNWYIHGLVLVGLHRYPEARETFNRALEVQPKAARIQTQFATLDILQNNPKGALEHAQLEQEGFWRDYAMAMVLQAGSDEPAARAALKSIIDRYAKIASFQVAILYAQRNEPDEMFKWLEAAYANRDAGLTRIFVAPFLMDYRDDPRFAAFCRKLGIESLQPK